MPMIYQFLVPGIVGAITNQKITLSRCISSDYNKTWHVNPFALLTIQTYLSNCCSVIP